MNDEEIKKEEVNEEDDVVEFEFNEDGEEDLKATLKKLRKDKKEIQKQKDEYLASWQRERADFANFKRDSAGILERMKGQGIEKAVEAILPGLDSFDMAMGNKEAWEKVDTNWRMGVEYIRSQFGNALENLGVTVFGAVGDAFDPLLHEIVGSEETDDAKLDHTIATVVQRGYKQGERIIRPARVKVWEKK